ncbi:MAG: pilus assembly PilX N-terminal domain-containing protein [bacterium]|nr:pilus assembly PilX N-terminal domain-containing protein [bacterium]
MMKLKQNQDGLVAIVVSMMFIIIITLVVVSFAFLMRREQQQVLDRQLSTQAFYAAESGVNDHVAKLIKGESFVDSTDCTGAPVQLDSDSNAFYSCVIVDQSLPDVRFPTDLTKDESKLVRLTSSDPDRPIHSIDVLWEAVESESKGKFASNDVYNLPTDTFSQSNKKSFANYIAVVDTMVIPISNIDSVNRTQINDAAKSFFAYPSTENQNSSKIDYRSPAADGAFVGGGCDQAKADGRPLECKANINNLGGVKDVVVRVKPLYKNANIRLVARDKKGEQVDIIGVQAEIDSTGRANDVLRRIQVRIPLQGNQGYFPEFVLESGDDICKRLRLQIDTGRDLCL